MLNSPGEPNPAESGLRKVFEQALELEPSARHAFLEEACGSDSALRDQVGQLLGAHEDCEGALEESIGDPWLSARKPASSLEGMQLGKYRILRRIATGGMGTVFEAEQTSPQRRIALKVLHRDLVSPTWIRRFELEGQVLAMLRHPGITQIYEAGVAHEASGSIPFFAMELVEGQELDQYVKSRNCSRKERIELFCRICEAVQHAHQHGVIHRDLKPANILVDDTGQPKILDFGISRARSDEVAPPTQHTQAGQLMGTLEYMSPEQAQGVPEEIDTRSDIYSLGAVLYEILTEEKPFDFSNRTILEIISIIQNQTPRRPQSLDRSLPGELETIVLKALEKEKAQRYSSASELSGDLCRYLRGEPILARPPSTLYHLRKLVLRHKLPATLIAAVFGLTIVYAVFARIQMLSTEHSRLEEKQARVAAEEAKTEAEYQQYRARIAAAQSALQLGKVASAKFHLSEAPPMFRQWEWQHLQSTADQSLDVLTCDAPGIWAVDFSHDGKLLAHSTGSGDIRIWELQPKRLQRDIRGAHTTRSLFTLDFHPTLPYLVSAEEGGRIKIWSLEDSTLQSELTWNPRLGRALFHPGGAQLAVAGPGNVATLLDWSPSASTLTTRRAFEHPLEVYWVDYDGSGRRLITTCRDEKLRLWSVETGQLLAEVDAFPETQNLHRHRWFATFGPRGEWIATGGIENCIRIFTTPNLAPLTVLRGHTMRVHDMRFSPDRRWLVSTSSDETARVWDLEEPSQPRLLRGHQAEVWGVAYHPHRALIATAGGTSSVRLWDPHVVGDFTELRDHTTDVNSVAVSPDGRFIASGGIDPDLAVRLWDGTTGNQIARLQGLQQHVARLAFSRDGRKVAGCDRTPRVCIWDIDSEGEPTPLSHGSGVWSLTCDAGSDRLATGTLEGTIELWDISAATHVATLSGHEDAVVGLVLHPESSTLVSASVDGTLRVWDTRTHRETRRVLVGSDERGFDPFGDPLSLNPRGDLVATGHLDRVVRLWRLPSGELQGELRGHYAKVFSVDFSADGQRLASGAADRTLTIWDVPRRQAVLSLGGHGGWVFSVRFSDDGSRVVTGCTDGVVRLWDSRHHRELVAHE